MKLNVNNVRCAFPFFFEPKINDDGKGSFGGGFIFAPEHPAKAALDKAIDEVGSSKWGQKWAVIRKEMKAGDNLLIHDGDAKASLDGYEGNLYFNANNKVRPTVVNRDRTPLTAADGVIYSGCYVNVIVDLWAQDNKFGKKINAQLQGVQFARDGDAFAGGGKAADSGDFDVIEDGADAEDLV
jgi:hypothetical protein